MADAAATFARRTPLYPAHVASGARFVSFGGWEMPVQYSGILREHHAVREFAGLFDVSHMGEIEVRGPRALEVCQRLVTNDVGNNAIGGAQYTAICLPDGGIVDDVIWYRLSDDRLLFCVNASNRDKDLAWISDVCRGAEIVDRSDETSLLAIQGPKAAEIVSRVLGDRVASIGRFRVVELPDGALVSRTGYTGEDGFELYVPNERAVDLWESLLEAGARDGLVPAGLGARDTLRLEAALRLYGSDIDETTTPLEAGLGWVVDWSSGDFVGRAALEEQRAEGPRRLLVGLEIAAGPSPRHGHAIVGPAGPVGEVTSGSRSPSLGRGIALGYVAHEHARDPRELAIEIRGKAHAANVVRLPFWKRA